MIVSANFTKHWFFPFKENFAGENSTTYQSIYLFYNFIPNSFFVTAELPNKNRKRMRVSEFILCI